MDWVSRWQHCHMVSMIVSALLFFSSLGGSVAFSSGNVEVACDSMTPLHGVDSQSTPPPHTVTGVQNPDGSINVRLGSTSADGIFEGFLLQARNSSGKRVGVFSNQPDATQLLNCDFPGGAVSHKGNPKRNCVDVLWQPQGYTGNVQFRATVVQSLPTFWTGITSENFEIQPVQSGSPGPSLSPLIKTLPNLQPQPQPLCGIYPPATQSRQPRSEYQPPVQLQPQPPGVIFKPPTQTQPPFVFPLNPSPEIPQPPTGYLPPIG